jgi:hypothetical protein
VRSFAASQAIRFQRKRTLDYSDVAETIEVAVWWAGRITKAVLSVLNSKNDEETEPLTPNLINAFCEK